MFCNPDFDVNYSTHFFVQVSFKETKWSLSLRNNAFFTAAVNKFINWEQKSNFKKAGRTLFAITPWNMRYLLCHGHHHSRKSTDFIKTSIATRSVKCVHLHTVGPLHNSNVLLIRLSPNYLFSCLFIHRYVSKLLYVLILCSFHFIRTSWFHFQFVFVDNWIKQSHNIMYMYYCTF